MNILKYFHLKPKYECFGGRVGFFLTVETVSCINVNNKFNEFTCQKWWQADIMESNIILAIKGKKKRAFEVDHGDKVVDAYPVYWFRIDFSSWRFWKHRLFLSGVYPFNENVGLHRNNGY